LFTSWNHILISQSFLCSALGYFIGQFKFRGFGLGPVTGALFAGLLIGQFAEVPVSEVARSILFLLFLFGIGYSVGPKFLSAVKGDGLPGIAIGILVPLTAIATAVIAVRVLRAGCGLRRRAFFRRHHRITGHWHSGRSHSRAAHPEGTARPDDQPYRRC